MDTQSRELALGLMNRLIALEAERTVMAGILECVRTQYNLPLDWRSDLRHRCTFDQITLGAAAGKYEQIRQSLLASAPDPDATALLALVPTDRIWEKP